MADDTALALLRYVQEDEKDQTMEHFEPGVLIDHNRPVDELYVEVIRLAMAEGWPADDDTRCALDMYENGEEWWSSDVVPLSEALQWSEDDATEWLNDNRCPEGYWIGHDGEVGAFGVWEIDEDML